MTHSIHIIGSQRLGGAESFFMRLVTALNAGDHAALAVSRPGSEVNRALQGKAPQYPVAMKNQLDIASRWRISRLIKRERPAIVQTYMTRATMLTHVRPSSGVCHVARLGGYYKVKRFAHAHAWIGNTRGICDYLVREGLPADKVHYIGNFVADLKHLDSAGVDRLKREMGIPDDAWVLSTAGRFVAKKGFDQLLAAWARLGDEVAGRPVHLILVGDGPDREALKQQASRYANAERIHWPGWQTDPSPWFSLADIHVCPSRHEPLGNVILEGWALGKPVISTETLGGKELITAGENGLLAPVDDAAGLADAIRQCLLDDDLRRGIAESGHQTLQREFSSERIVNDYLALYSQLARDINNE